jgi:zinc protease
MTRPLILTVFLAVLSSTAAPQSTVPVTKSTIAGIPVIHKRVTANDVIAVQLYLKGGSAALTPATSGIESLLGSVMTKGTAKYTKDQFAALSTSTGTTIGANAGYDYTSFTAQGVRQYWNETWDLFTQAVAHPTFPEDEVGQASDQMVNALKQRVDDPDTYLEEIADSAVYAGHPYAIDPAGTPDVVAKLTRDDVVRWHRTRLTKENLLIVVVGNVTPADLQAKVTAAFGSLPTGGGAASALPAVASAKGTPVTSKREVPTNYIEMIFAAPGPGHADFTATRVAILILTERLFEEVRTKRNLSYATFAQLNTRMANRGRLYVTAVDPDTTIKVMLAEVKRLQDEPVAAQRLRESVGVFATNYLMSQQTNLGQAGSLGLWELAGGGWPNQVNYVNRLRAVTPADVQRAARTYLKDFRLVVVGDPAKVTASLVGGR